MKEITQTRRGKAVETLTGTGAPSGASARASGVVTRVMWCVEGLQVMRGSPEEMKEAVLVLFLLYSLEKEDPCFCPRCQGQIP